jgi:hypothetical protein
MPREIKDIAGLGELAGHIKDLIVKIIEHRSHRVERHLRNERLRLQNARTFLQMASDFNMTPKDLKSCIHLANQPNLIVGNQFYALSIADDKGDLL